MEKKNSLFFAHNFSLVDVLETIGYVLFSDFLVLEGKTALSSVVEACGV